MSKKSKSQRRRFNWVLFLIICILVVFAFILSESDKIEHASQTSRTIQMGLLQTAEPTIILPSPTPFPSDYPKLPAEYFENEDQTDGVILGGTVLVLIILIGTMVFIQKEHQKKNEK